MAVINCVIKPINVVNTACQWTGDNLEEIMKFLESEFEYRPNTCYATNKFTYHNNSNRLYLVKGGTPSPEVNVGDYIVKTPMGNYGRVLKDLFPKAYDVVGDTEKTDFKVGDVVIYVPGENFKCDLNLGVIKEVLPDNQYFVYYHTGDTASRTDGSMLRKINNGYAFEINRRKAD